MCSCGDFLRGDGFGRGMRFYQLQIRQLRGNPTFMEKEEGSGECVPSGRGFPKGS